MEEAADAITEDIELIETLWNVNNSRYKVFLYRFLELIETLWNVNKSLNKYQR